MERELTIECTRAGLEIARQHGRKRGRKRQMTDRKIESAKKLLANRGATLGCSQESWGVSANSIPMDT